MCSSATVITGFLLVACFSGITHSTEAEADQQLEQPDELNSDWVGSQLFRKPQVDGKIVGGTPAQIKDFPYQLSLRYRGRHICGASIISSNFVITAAHCIGGERVPSRLSLKAGSSNLYTGGTKHSVVKIVVHSQYTDFSEDYDLAILKVREPFKASNSISLPQSGAVIESGTVAIVTGWGVTREGSISPAFQLQSVSVPIVDNVECAYSYIGYGEITQRMLCAGYKLGQKDACQGDSGGPLVANGVLVGVVSWGAGCARPGLPGVYTNLADPAMRAWISANAEGL
ncbi:trypsin-7-like [Neocloeon triangulifer]|uniref:trypsin-7-like n=1 Tax=Neocloeon triangulifer TaxID=2078957 RepID=UPI00286F6EBA|nr:trypsin-7-like [Neocloeon triangulifer]